MSPCLLATCCLRSGCNSTLRLIVPVFCCFAPLFAQVQDKAAAGNAIFNGKGECLKCHSIDNHGGSLGPDLTEIALRRTRESIRLALTDPNAEVGKQYLTVVVKTNQGERVEGIGLNEDDVSIQIRDTDGNLHSFSKDNLTEVHREQRSLMPSYASRLSSREIDDIVGFLETLRGHAEPAAARKRAPGPLTTNTSWITRANRDAQELPDTLLDSLRIHPGATIVDLGAGAGYFTWRLAQRTGPRGKVFAVDIQPQMLKLIEREVKKRGMGNVELIQGTPADPHLPDASADMVFIANAYGEFSRPEAIMAAVRRALKPDGYLVVIEYASENDEDPTAGVYTMTLADLRSEIESMGFDLRQILDFLPLQHGLVFSPRS